MRFYLALFVAALTGFVSLSYEILWYRVYAYSTVFAPQTFGVLLGVFLLGLAFGSSWIRDNTHSRWLARYFIAGLVLAYLVIPAVAWSQLFWVNPYMPGSAFSLPLVFLATLMFGASFPLICHHVMAADQNAGRSLSLLYVANIIGSALGSFLTGYLLLDAFGLQQVAFIVVVLNTVLILAIFQLTSMSLRRLVIYGLSLVGVMVAIVGSNSFLFDDIFERLILKSPLITSTNIVELIENRHGIIAVTDDDTILGSGVYDGRISTSLVDDRNAIERAYAVAAIHPSPKRVLMIGLSGGAWAQVVASMPEVNELLIVEINPGYLPIVARYPDVSALLQNPKVRIEIDDGRRWMTRHSNETFDVIMQNTTWHFIANATHLLSREYLQLSRQHLRSGGVLYFNTTASIDVMKTASEVFSHVLRVQNLIAASDKPIMFRKDRWEASLRRAHIDEHPQRFAALLRFADSAGDEPGAWTLETQDRLLPRIRDGKAVTDDNMLIEWKWWSDRWLFSY